MIVKTGCGTDGALHSTSPNIYPAADAEANAKVQRTTTSLSPGRSGAAAASRQISKVLNYCFAPHFSLAILLIFSQIGRSTNDL